MLRSMPYYVIKGLTQFIVLTPLIFVLSGKYHVPILLAAIVGTLAGGAVGISVAELLPSERRRNTRELKG